jgi:uncharacterized C2H2 Zn-finger protein
MIFPSKNSLVAHSNKRHDQNYQCQVGQEIFEKKNDMISHIKNTHSEKSPRK